MTACPCAQEMVSERSRERLRADGFTDDEIDARLRARAGGHPQPARHRHALRRLPRELRRERSRRRDLLEIVEASMSSEIYELMKRPDEVEVVEKAHRRPRFVEDCVREMIRMAVERFGRLGDDAFVSPARRTSRRSTSTTSWPSATAWSPSSERDRDRRARGPSGDRCASGSRAPEHSPLQAAARRCRCSP